MRRYGYKINPVLYQGRYPINTFIFAERRNKKAGRRLNRKLIAGAEQSLKEFWIPLYTAKRETKNPRYCQKYSAVEGDGRPLYQIR